VPWQGFFETQEDVFKVNFPRVLSNDIKAKQIFAYFENPDSLGRVN
jgi:hypothetical protein